MSIDIYHSRRGKFRRCRYWVRDTSKNIDRSKFVLENKATGVFYAEEVDSIVNDQKQVLNVMMFDKNSVSLETRDEVDDISRGSIVEYNGDIWFVENVQFIPHKKETEFSNKLHFTTLLNLRK